MTATPTLTGVPPFSPVICIKPASASITTSYPGAWAYGPVEPYPVIEQ